MTTTFQINLPSTFIIPAFYIREDPKICALALEVGATSVSNVMEFTDSQMITLQRTQSFAINESLKSEKDLLSESYCNARTRICELSSRAEQDSHKIAMLESSYSSINDKYKDLLQKYQESCTKANEEAKRIAEKEIDQRLEKVKAELDKEYIKIIEREKTKERENIKNEIDRICEIQKRELTRYERENNILREQVEQLNSDHNGYIRQILERLSPSNTTKLISGNTSSSHIGRTYEQMMISLIKESYGCLDGFDLIDVHASGHEGDMILSCLGLRVLIELKAYDSKVRVPTKEIEKMARDLNTIEPKCDAGIMFSACSEITGHHRCGPIEVSMNTACVPVLFVGPFLNLGDPHVTLHMCRVFINMIKEIVENKKLSDPDIVDENEAKKCLEYRKFYLNECARSCSTFITDIGRQSSSLLKQASAMKLAAVKIRESIEQFIDCEITRFNTLRELANKGIKYGDFKDEKCEESVEEAVEENVMDPTVFNDLSDCQQENIKEIAGEINKNFLIGTDVERQITTKNMITFLSQILQSPDSKPRSDKACRDIIKIIFKEQRIQRGCITGIEEKKI